MAKKENGKKNAPTNGHLRKVDERSQQRVEVKLLVDYRGANGNYLFDFCKDLGAGGIFIQTDAPLPQGSEINLTFSLPNSKKVLATKGTVIWVQEPIKDRNDLTPGMGIQFSNFASDDRKLLEDFVASKKTQNTPLSA